MKIAIIGASGWIGSTLAAEAINRGHEVIGIARDISKIPPGVQERRAFDFTGKESLVNAVAGADLVLGSVGGRNDGQFDIVSLAAERLLNELPAAGIPRLLWVGGAASLEVAPGVTLLSLPQFPEAYRNEASAMLKVLSIFRASKSPLNWTFVSPAAEIFPGERTGQYRIGGDQLLTDADGNSRISVQDYAVAMLDIAERGGYTQQRIGVAY